MVIWLVGTDSGETSRLVACIRESGHTSVTFDNVRTALQSMKAPYPGLVLLGLNGQGSQVASFMESSQSLPTPSKVIAISRKPNLEEAVEMMKLGAHDFWISPVHPERLTKTLAWVDERQAKASEPDGQPPGKMTLITQNPAMLQLKAMAKRVAASSATIFLQGESGTGKEVFARFIHHNSERRGKPFVALNCAALPESLIESELFGHEKGAFTGAIKTKEGKFELANTGTFFLDEITELPLHLQPKLLRVLQESEIDRIGGKRPVSVDVRVIAATNLQIEEVVRNGKFRKDLYYRLNVIPMKIPPLRDRTEDIKLLSKHFIEKYNLLHKCSVDALAPEALKLLESYSWPGNVRELENVIQRAVLLSQESVIGRDQVLLDDGIEDPSQSGSSELELMSISEMERLLIHKALSSFDGNRTRAAEILGISVRTLRNKLHEYRMADAPLAESLG
ncbi:MAG: sigma 54-interacting transcriptional regulator [Syntrophobacteraceae bacterium]